MPKDRTPKDRTIDRACTPSLLAALAQRDLDAARRALDSEGANPNSSDENLRSVLLQAAYLGLDYFVKLLLDSGADPDLEDESGWTPLMVAAQKDSPAIVALLVAGGADVNKANFEGYSPLMAAAGVGREASVELLLKHGAHVAGVQRSDGFTLLMAAASGGSLALCERLLDAGEPIDRVNQLGGWRALDFAAREGRVEVVKRLCERGASVIYRDKAKKSALDIARENQRTAVAELLLTWAQENVKPRDAELVAACRTGDTEAVRACLDAGASPDAQSEDGFPALALATFSGRVELVRLLLDRGANVNAPSTTGATALMGAAATENLDVLACLLARKASLEQRQMTGVSALACAAQLGKLKSVKALVAEHADVNALDASGNTPFTFALGNRHRDTAKFLLAHGATATSEQRSSLETVVEEPRDKPPLEAPLTSIDHSVIKLIRAGLIFFDSDKEGGWKRFRFADGRFFQEYGTHTGEFEDDTIVYGGEASFLHALVQVAQLSHPFGTPHDEVMKSAAEWILSMNEIHKTKPVATTAPPGIAIDGARIKTSPQDGIALQRFPSGRVKQGFLEEPLTIDGRSFVCEIALHESGRVRAGRLKEAAQIHNVRCCDVVYFYDSGELKAAKLASDTELAGIVWKGGQYIDLLKSGRVGAGCRASDRAFLKLTYSGDAAVVTLPSLACSTWERAIGARRVYLEVQGCDVVFGSGTSSLDDNAGSCTFREFLEGNFNQAVANELGAGVLAEARAAVEKLHRATSSAAIELETNFEVAL